MIIRTGKFRILCITSRGVKYFIAFGKMIGTEIKIKYIMHTSRFIAKILTKRNKISA